MEWINIAFNIDGKFVQHCAAVIGSVIRCHKNTERPCRFYIVYDGLSEEQILQMKTLVLGTLHQIHFVPIDVCWFNQFPIGENTISTEISISTYFRLLLPPLLPLDVHRVIYLDADVIVNDDIWNLWSIDLCGCAIGGIPDKYSNQRLNKLRCHIPQQYNYINAGVLLINLDFLRSLDFTQKVLDYIVNYRERIFYHDQDVLNSLLYNKIKYLPYKWNMMDCYLYKNPNCGPDYIEEVKASQLHPGIIHFAGFLKPWNLECINPYRNLYSTALSNTPWENWTKTRKYPIVQYMKFKLKLFLKGNPFFK
ncbi:glycosyltransferase family 8 protein [Paraprevotella clara]|uniref:glycosyltransferase family 8 protein n=1 Tax=Paraprevotella clara TaxID=454154 RepID=UPI0040291A81